MIQSTDLICPECLNTDILKDAMEDKKLTYEGVEKGCGIPAATVKNILTSKTKNPRSDTLRTLCKFLGVPIENVYDREKIHEEKVQIESQAIKEDHVSAIALKEIYEFQMAAIKETNEAHITNIRTHYENHVADLKENFEHRSEDKREIIRMQEEHIKTLKKVCAILGIALGVCLGILVALLIAEVMNPNLGWIKF